MAQETQDQTQPVLVGTSIPRVDGPDKVTGRARYAGDQVLPGMLARGSGYLLHTASMAGILTSHCNATYATTKHAVVGLAEWLSITYHHRGIRVSLLAPLGVRTPMLGDVRSPFATTVVGPIKEPDDVAAMVVDELVVWLVMARISYGLRCQLATNGMPSRLAGNCGGVSFIHFW